MSVVQSQEPPKLNSKNYSKSEKSIYHHAIQKLYKLKQTKPEAVEDAPELLTRNDLMLKLKELDSFIKDCQTTRRTQIQDDAINARVQVAKLEEVVLNKIHRTSTLLSMDSFMLKPGLNKSNLWMSKDNHSIYESSRSQDDSDTDSEFNFGVLDKMTSPADRRASLKLKISKRDSLDYELVKDDLKELEEEYMRYHQAKVDRKITGIELGVDEQPPEDLKSIRTYVKFIRNATKNSTKRFERKFVILDENDINVFDRPTDNYAQLSFPCSFINQVIDADSGDFKILYKLNVSLRCIVIKPLTKEDFLRWATVLKNIARQYEFSYSSSGELPEKQAEDDSPTIYTRRRKSTYYRSTQNPLQLIAENKLNPLNETSSDEESPQSSSFEISFNVDETIDEGTKLEKVKSTSSFSGSEGPIIEEFDQRTRTLTAYAELGKAEGLVNLLTKGGIFLKYGRWGKPHLRHILVTADLRYLEWRPINKPKATGGVAIFNIKSVEPGRVTRNFRRFNRPDRENFSFSLVCVNRTVDLEIVKENTVPREVWVEAFDQLISNRFRREQVQRFVSKKFERNEG